MMYISYILKPGDLKFRLHVVKTEFYSMGLHTLHVHTFFDFLGVWSESVVFFLGQG